MFSTNKFHCVVTKRSRLSVGSLCNMKAQDMKDHGTTPLAKSGSLHVPMPDIDISLKRNRKTLEISEPT